jgi:hypothetical protein
VAAPALALLAGCGGTVMAVAPPSPVALRTAACADGKEGCLELDLQRLECEGPGRIRLAPDGRAVVPQTTSYNWGALWPGSASAEAAMRDFDFVYAPETAYTYDVVPRNDSQAFAFRKIDGRIVATAALHKQNRGWVMTAGRAQMCGATVAPEPEPVYADDTEDEFYDDGFCDDEFDDDGFCGDDLDGVGIKKKRKKGSSFSSGSSGFSSSSSSSTRTRSRR